MTTFSKLYNALRGQIAAEGPVDTQLDVKCLNCAEKVRVRSWRQIQKGSHIVMNGENFLMNINGRQMSPYTHHAIVKSVDRVENLRNCALVTLIHFFSTPFDSTLKMRVTTEYLDFLYHEVYVYKYAHGTHSADRIIEIAEKLLAQYEKTPVKYSLFICNCENLCHLCCVGQDESFQVQSFRSIIQSVAFETGGLIGRLLHVLLRFAAVSIDEASSLACGAVTQASWGLLSVVALCYLLVTIWQHHQLNEKMKQGILCSSCCLREKQNLWMTFATYCCLQVGGLGLMTFVLTLSLSKGILIGATLASTLLIFGLVSSVPRLRKLIGSPFQGRLLRVNRLTDISKGDVISVDHWKISHDAIVSSVTIKPDTDQREGKLTIIHYSLPSVFGQRQIVEEEIEIQLPGHFIKLHDYSGHRVHKPEDVIKRARQRLGETKFGLFSNRSCHLCHWAKIYGEFDEVIDEGGPEDVERFELIYLRDIDFGESFSGLQSVHVNQMRKRVQTSRLIKETWAHIREDVHPGEIVSFKYGLLWQKAVCTAVAFRDESVSVVDVWLVHYGRKGKVVEEMFTFDLKTQDIWIYKYHPIYKYSTNEIIRRAHSRVGNIDYRILSHRSSHLAEEIALKDVDSRIDNFADIQKGDVIIVMYWGLKHACIVTTVNANDSKPGTEGRITIVHYALDSLFSTRYVKEESIPADLSRDWIWKKNYTGYQTYPPRLVVKRAQSRIGEKRFNIMGNTSWDLVHWAKVVQTPAIVVKPAQAGQHDEGEKYVIVPRTGTVYDGFQRLPVASWEDLKPGIILDYYYYWILHQGVLTEVNKKDQEIHVIHYGASHLFARRAIVKDILKVDLKKQNLWFYITDPRKCHKALEIVRRARRRLGEQKWRSGNRSWDFCKDCVLKEESQEV